MTATGPPARLPGGTLAGMGVHEAASSGFGAGADDYERGRPSYPDDAVAVLVDRLGIGPGRQVLDVAAGTGKLTRLLASTGAEVLALEPVAAMRDHLVEIVDGVTIVDGTAEAIDLPDDSLDAVTVGQAFHWFDTEAALAEAARVLRPGGGLGLIWNERDTSEPWVAELSRLIRWDEREQVSRVPYTLEVDWAARIDALPTAFGPVQRYETTFRQVLDVDTLVARVLSTSYLASLDQPTKDELAAQVRELVADQPDPFVLPYETVAYWCHLR